MRSRKYGFGSFIFLFFISSGFLLLFAFGADQLCRNDIAKRLPFYPDAELVFQEKDLLRYRAAGTTTMVFHSTDDPEVVQQWYRDLNLEQLDQGILRGFADISRRSEANPDGGTTIYYRTACGT